MKQKDIQRILIAVLLVVEFCFMFLSVKSYTSKDIEEIQEVNEVDNQTFAMYIENDEGNYEEAIDTGTFPEGYILNLEMTSCIDNKGNSVSDILTLRDDKVTVKSNKTVFCYLYFDKDNRVFAQVKRDYKNNMGALLLSKTESDEYPVYYYNGDITNNNILYANFCWKMVRTTETGGVKLIYNGVPDEGEDGTLTCDNTGDESQIGTSAFNKLYNSLAYVGYMYNTVYKYNSTGFTNYTNVYTNYHMSSSSSYIYYYGDKAVWNEETQQYDLKLSDDTDVTETTTWSSSTYSSLVGKYTCLDTAYTSCATVYYIAGGDSSYMYNYGISNNTTKDDYKIKLATSVTDNGDGTYTLVNPIEVSKADWPATYSNYKNYYYCNDLTSETCGVNDTIMYYSTSTNPISLTGLKRSPYKYGNSVIYENGIYKLVDTIEFWNWPENYNTLNNYHYTCFNVTGECEKVGYIHFANFGNAIYITLSDGELVENAINKMLHAEDINKIDSTIKNKIDSWYENNVVDIFDSNNILYSIYLENTIWCNNREISDLAGWNPNGGNISTYLYFDYNSLECVNKTDQFTLKVEAGGTEGYGNNALDYPIGLISYKEASLASSNGYLKSGNYYWLISPNIYDDRYAYGSRISNNGGLYRDNVFYTSYGVRPSVSLSNKVEITSGDGSVSNPYQVILSN